MSIRSQVYTFSKGSGYFGTPNMKNKYI